MTRCRAAGPQTSLAGLGVLRPSVLGPVTPLPPHPQHPPPYPAMPSAPALPLFQLVRPRPTSVRLSACHPGVMPLSQPLRGPFDSEAARVCPIIREPDTGMNC